MAKPTKARLNKPRNKLSAEYVRTLFHYDPSTGFLTWKWRDDVFKSWNVRYAGKKAGAPNTNGHLQVGINYKLYLVHHIIWLLVTGKHLRKEIDHKNCVKADNSWDNLRPATRLQNARNRPLDRDSTSGLKGAHWNKRRCCWTSSIFNRGKLKYLGYFKTAQEAHATYCEAAKKLHKNFARFK
jgi:hypothetical protein